jgi:hypothetical protein
MGQSLVGYMILPKEIRMSLLSLPNKLQYYLGLLTAFRSLVCHSPQQKDFLLWYEKYGSWIPEFHNRYLGEDCFLLANGPSLNEVNFEYLNNYHLIGLNKIYLLLERVELSLTFHVAINELVIQHSWDQFQLLKCPSFLSYVPASKYTSGAPNLKYFLTEPNPVPRFSRVYDEALWEGWTVTYAALQLAYFMGFTNIFIVGLDHSFKMLGNPNEEQSMKGDDPNHFDPRYFADSRWHLPDLEGSEMAYKIAKFAFQRSGKAIYDATQKGHCRIFDRITLDDAFLRAKPR